MMPLGRDFPTLLPRLQTSSTADVNAATGIDHNGRRAYLREGGDEGDEGLLCQTTFLLCVRCPGVFKFPRERDFVLHQIVQRKLKPLRDNRTKCHMLQESSLVHKPIRSQDTHVCALSYPHLVCLVHRNAIYREPRENRPVREGWLVALEHRGEHLVRRDSRLKDDDVRFRNPFLGHSRWRRSVWST